jgi:hypothetical protein
MEQKGDIILYGRGQNSLRFELAYTRRDIPNAQTLQLYN